MDKIKKIILSLYNINQIKRIIIVKNNRIQRYSLEKYNQDNLMKIYSESVLELKKEYEKDLEGLNNQDKINKLSLMNKIERNEKNLILQVDYFENENKIIIYYEDGTIKENNINKNNFIELIYNLCKIYAIEFNKNDIFNSLNHLEKIGIIRRKTIIKDNKIKNLKINHHFLSSIIALGMIGGIIGGIKLFNQSNIDKKIEPTLSISKNTSNNIDLKNIYEQLMFNIKNNIKNSDEIKELLFELKKRELINEKNNFLNNLNKSPYLTTTNFSNHKFIIIDTKKGYDNILLEKGMQIEDECFEWAILYADSIYADSNAYSKTGVRMDKNVVATESEQRLLQIMAKEILEGRPSIIKVNGLNGGRHFVLVVGIVDNYNKNKLKQSDFLIADPSSAGLKILNTEIGGQRRYLIKAEDDKNWSDRDGDSNGYMVALSNYAEEYITFDVEKGVVPWITYIPKTI